MDDKLRQEVGDNEHAFDQVAIIIADIDIPISKDRAITATPEERASTPADWIDNYAAGMARTGNCSHEEATTGIRAAFENRYDMSPEAYLDRYRPKQASTDKAMERAFEKVSEKEQDETRHRAERDQGRERDNR